jgi:hypothetical protein
VRVFKAWADVFAAPHSESPCDHFVSILVLNKPYVGSRAVSIGQKINRDM